jgi:hypothetical protein
MNVDANRRQVPMENDFSVFDRSGAFAVDLQGHVKEFAVKGLWGALKDFGCGDFEADAQISWFWRVAPTWAPQKSQADFNRYARERISDHVGYSRRRTIAWGVIDRLYDKAREDGVSFEEVIDAIRFLCPTQPFPTELCQENGRHVLIDLTKRDDSPKILKVDAEFWDVLQSLYPWERVENRIVKQIPVGSTTRGFDLRTLAFWRLYPDASREEREHGCEFHKPDPLDWSAENMYSKWREGPDFERYRDRFWGTPMEKRMLNGDMKIIGGKVIPAFDDNLLSNETWAHSKPTAHVLNDRK